MSEISKKSVKKKKVSKRTEKETRNLLQQKKPFQSQLTQNLKQEQISFNNFNERQITPTYGVLKQSEASIFSVPFQGDQSLTE